MASSIKIEFFLVFIFLPIILFFIPETKLIFTTLYIVFFSLWKIKKDKTFNFSRLKNKPDWKFIFLYFLIFFFAWFFLHIFCRQKSFFYFSKRKPKCLVTCNYSIPIIFSNTTRIYLQSFFFAKI